MPTQGGVFSPALRTEGDGSRDSDFNYNAVLSGDHTGTSNSRTASLINQSGMRAIRQATVVIDARQAGVNALTSLVDYAAFVGLAEIRPGATTRSSILDLFSSGDFQRLSRNDLALLKGLYALQLTRKAEQHRRVLVAAILKERLQKDAAATGR